MRFAIVEFNVPYRVGLEDMLNHAWKVFLGIVWFREGVLCSSRLRLRRFHDAEDLSRAHM